MSCRDPHQEGDAIQQRQPEVTMLEASRGVVKADAQRSSLGGTAGKPVNDICHSGHIRQQGEQVQLQQGPAPWLTYKGKWGSTVEAPALQEWFAKAENPVSRSWLAQARLCRLCRSLTHCTVL